MYMQLHYINDIRNDIHTCTKNAYGDFFINEQLIQGNKMKNNFLLLQFCLMFKNNSKSKISDYFCIGDTVSYKII